jgi:hypothetical protein
MSGGMFAKDKEFGTDIKDWAAEGDRFILWGVNVQDEKVKTDLGDATKTVLTVSRLDSPENRVEVGTLGSAIAEKAALAVPEDFPAVVKYHKVATTKGNPAAVLTFIEPYDPTN